MMEINSSFASVWYNRTASPITLIQAYLFPLPVGRTSLLLGVTPLPLSATLSLIQSLLLSVLRAAFHLRVCSFINSGVIYKF